MSADPSTFWVTAKIIVNSVSLCLCRNLLVYLEQWSPLMMMSKPLSWVRLGCFGTTHSGCRGYEVPYLMWLKITCSWSIETVISSNFCLYQPPFTMAFSFLSASKGLSRCYDFRRLRQSSTVVVSKVWSQMSLDECKSWTCIVLLGLRMKVQVKGLSIKD